jgi:hypothetical protein
MKSRCPRARTCQGAASTRLLSTGSNTFGTIRVVVDLLAVLF